MAAFVAAIVLFLALNGSADDAVKGQASSGPTSGPRSTQAQIDSLQQVLANGPRTADRYALLGNAYLERARETGDSRFYLDAERAFDSGLDLDRRSPGAYAGLSALRLAQHDFAAGLRFAQRAHSLAPDVVRIYGSLIDGLVELGRYGDAERTIQEMIDLKPNLASYARASYLRELHGDLRGASEAMRLAVAAGGDNAENGAYVQSLLGNLELEQGHLRAARRAYSTALSLNAGYPAAEAGLARLDWARGDVERAIERLRPVAEQGGPPEYAIALAESEDAAGQRAGAAKHHALVRAEYANLVRSGENTDTERAVYEASHGNPSRAVGLARRGWRAAPSVRSADALGWALTRAGRPEQGIHWAQEALKLGSRDRLFLYHAGMAARGAGDTALAKRWLSEALRGTPAFSPLHMERARHALAKL